MRGEANSDISTRRAAITAEIVNRTGIDDEMIERLVFAFYSKVRRDGLLGPIFDRHVTNWPTHLERMCAFWSSVALMSGAYHGQPMAKHLNLPIDAIHFDRWLALFEETATGTCPPVAAEHFVHRARTIARSLEAGRAAQLEIRLDANERLRTP